MQAKRWLAERGQSLVELALVTPVLLVVIFSVAEIGFIISDQITLTHAARDGAHAGAAPHGPLPAALAASRSAAQTEAQAVASDGLRNCSTPTVTTSTSGGGPYDLTVTVTCTYTFVTPLGPLASLAGGSLSTTRTLSATTIYRVQQ